jgi:hypothetical protein
MMVSVDVSLSYICDKDRKKYDDTRSILKRNTVVFILVQILSIFVVSLLVPKHVIEPDNFDP